MLFFFFQAEDGIRDLVRSRGLGDVYKRQGRPRDVGGAERLIDERFLVAVEDGGLGVLVAVEADAVLQGEPTLGVVGVVEHRVLERRSHAQVQVDVLLCRGRAAEAVSYTHLTLPTSDLV